MAKRVIPTDLLKKAIALYQSGMSIKDVALSIDIPKSTIRYWLFISGIPRDRRSRISAKMKERKWHPSRKYSISENEREKKRIAAIGNKWSVGRKISEETRRKMSASRKGKNTKYSPEFKKHLESVRQSCKRFIRRVLNASGKRKIIPSEIYLGYSKHDLLKALGPRPEGHELDHKIPMAEFFRNGIFDPQIINAISNLQWLPKSENRKKSDSVDPRMRGEVMTANFAGGKPSYTQGLS